MHAFVTSVQLMRAADELLPLTADGQPALPADTLVAQQAEAQAFLLAATATFIAPDVVEWEGRQVNRLGRYAQRRVSLAGGRPNAAYLPALQPLGGLLVMYLYAGMIPNLPESVQLCQTSVACLTQQALRSMTSRQLQQMQRSSEHTLLTIDQLEAAFHYLITRCGSEAGSQAGSAATAALAKSVAASGERVLALQPGTPKGFLSAATTASGCAAANISRAGFSEFNAAMQRSMSQLLSAVRCAQAQRSPYWTVNSASIALQVAMTPAVAISRADLEALVAAAEGVPAAVKQLSPVLPQLWVANLKQRASLVAAMLPAVRAQLQGSLLEASERAVQAWGDVETVSQQDQPSASCTCSGCGTRAIGLRRCARCKQAACEWGARGGDALPVIVGVRSLQA